MSRINWKDAPHEKAFWGAIIIIAIVSLLLFAKTIAGQMAGFS